MTTSIKIGDSGTTESFVCFAKSRRIAEGSLAQVAMAAWKWLHANPTEPTLTFDRKSGAVVDLNLSGTEADVARRYAAKSEVLAKRGRPKLGVVAREITLLPRHWEWLSQQPGGASITLRRLVEAARKERFAEHADRDTVAAAYKFMSAAAGDLPNFEEASRALFSRQFGKLNDQVAAWPKDIRDELLRWLQPVTDA